MYHSNKIGLGHTIFLWIFNLTTPQLWSESPRSGDFFWMSRSLVGIPKKENALGSAFLEVLSLGKLYKSTTKLKKNN